MNTDQERAVLAIAQEGATYGGDMDAPTGWFGVAHVTPAHADWLAEEHDLELPPEGWYMVTENSDGMIFTMPGPEDLCHRWFDSMAFAYDCYEPDEDTEEARLWLVNTKHMYHLALSSLSAEDLERRTRRHLERAGVSVENVDWKVLHHLVSEGA